MTNQSDDQLIADFATDASLKILDKNSDGKLDDSEIDALKPGHKGKAGGAAKKAKASA